MDDIAIRVTDVSKTFKLPHEKHGSIKNAFINIFRGRRTYEKQQVLKDVSFDIKKGEFFGIVGRNGSGKSTLLKLMAGIYSPNEGAIQVNGKLTPFIELGVGFNPELTGRENIFLNGALLGFSRSEMTKMYAEIVEFAELEKFMDQKLKNYSSGMQVRLAFSIAIRAQPDILVLDEVLAVGDANFQQKCYEYFESLKSQKKTVVFVSHDMDAVKRFCTKALYIKDGKISKKGDTADVADTYTIDNILNQKRSDEKDKSANQVKIKIVSKSANQVKIKVSYKLSKKEKTYAGISILKEGISIAEIISDKEKTLTGSGHIYFLLETSIFNPGIYSIGAGLFNVASRKQICGTGMDGRERIVIEGKDEIRGAALKLQDTWQYEE